ncbi:Carboxyl-terminal protease precursor [Anopheles sinensis]|uniref:Carboxyl-terminal protease n=1 Tax=Anopheles sinensis TaxID=74873 RepID=A0A084W9H4_ANOSI|nr:Carboxyl-terminal protease precursor [Anopheles sinensis]
MNAPSTVANAPEWRTGSRDRSSCTGKSGPIPERAKWRRRTPRDIPSDREPSPAGI